MSNSIFLTSRYKKYYQNITPLFKQKRIQAYTMVVLSLLTISFFSFFAIRPTIKTIIVLQKQIEDRTVVSDALDQKINALITAQTEYSKIENNINIIYSLLPEKPEVTSLLMKLEKLTEDSGATISAITFDPVVLYGDAPQETATPDENVTPTTTGTDVLAAETENAETPATPIAFTISYTGTYSDLTQIMKKLIELDRVVTMDSVELKLSDTRQSVVLSIHMESKAFYYPVN